MNKKILKFPDNFFWGAATSAHQVEGGNYNDWSEWEKERARIQAQSGGSTYHKPSDPELQKQANDPSNYISGRACDHYNRYEEDFDVAKSLNQNVHRFSIEWSRIEPEEGKFNQKEIEHYRRVIAALRERNIEPFVTLWHYTHPIWFSKQGGWVNPKAKNQFLRYVEKIVSQLKDDVKFWITENEPETVARDSYLIGTRPPRKKNIFKAFKALNTLVEAHNEAYDLIHSIDSGAKVGCAESLVYFESYNKWPHNLMAKKIIEHWRNGRFIPKIINHSDFIGLQYYFHSRIRVNPFKSWKGFQFNDNEKITDMGWEIYPEGIYHVLKNLKKYNLPIIITENGLADYKDKYREDFIKDHLKWTHKAIQEGVDVRGYFYWSLMDNFEWESGFWPRFGLVEIDYRTLERKIRPSARAYGEICKNNKLIL
jgi:beta-glucosidase